MPGRLLWIPVRDYIQQIRNALTIGMDEFGRVLDRADVHQIKRAERHRADRKDDADALGAAENLLPDCQFEWIEIDTARQQISLPDSPE